jgi:hypothetical protein
MWKVIRGGPQVRWRSRWKYCPFCGGKINVSKAIGIVWCYRCAKVYWRQSGEATEYKPRDYFRGDEAVGKTRDESADVVSAAS